MRNAFMIIIFIICFYQNSFVSYFSDFLLFQIDFFLSIKRIEKVKNKIKTKLKAIVKNVNIKY